MGKIFFLFLIVGLHCPLLLMAQDSTKATIIQVSQSKKSIKINRGQLEGIKKGDLVKFVWQAGTLEKPKLITVAYGEAIVARDKDSLWYLSQVVHPVLLRAQRQLLLLDLNRLMEGRRPFRIKQNKIVLAPNASKDSIKKNLLGQKKQLVQDEKNYSTSRKLVGTSVDLDHDVETNNTDQWKEGKKDKWQSEYSQNMSQAKVDQVDKVMDAKKVRQEVRKDVFNSTTEGVNKKYNSQPGGLDQLYAKQKRDPDFKQMQDKGTVRTVFDEVQDKKFEASLVDKRAVEKMRHGGAFWSGDMTDEELEEFFIKGQLDKEVKRRRSALEHRKGNEILVRFGQGLNQTSSQVDENYQRTSKELELGYEFHLIRSAKALEKWSLEGYYIQGLHYYDMGTFNARSSENSFLLGVNYYFYNDPTIVDNYMGYLGLGYQFGNATLESPFLSEELKYTIKASPIVNLGGKYRFRIGDGEFFKMGIALVALASYAPIQLASEEITPAGVDGTITTSELKLTLGLSVFF